MNSWDRDFQRMHNEYLDPDRWHPHDETCQICFLHYDDCKCPECPDCHEIGDPDCYLYHSLEVSDEQVEHNRRVTAEWMKAVEEENKYWQEHNLTEDFIKDMEE